MVQMTQHFVASGKLERVETCVADLLPHMHYKKGIWIYLEIKLMFGANQKWDRLYIFFFSKLAFTKGHMVNQ